MDFSILERLTSRVLFFLLQTFKVEYDHQLGKVKQLVEL